MSFRDKVSRFFKEVSGLNLPKERYLTIIPPEPNWTIDEVKLVLAELKISAYVYPIKNDNKCFNIKTLIDPPATFQYKNKTWEIVKRTPKRRVAICYLNNLPLVEADTIINKYVELTGELVEIKKKIVDEIITSCSISSPVSSTYLLI